MAYNLDAILPFAEAILDLHNQNLSLQLIEEEIAAAQKTEDQAKARAADALKVLDAHKQQLLEIKDQINIYTKSCSELQVQHRQTIDKLRDDYKNETAKLASAQTEVTDRLKAETEQARERLQDILDQKQSAMNALAKIKSDYEAFRNRFAA